jgi:hypothetical protein
MKQQLQANRLEQHNTFTAAQGSLLRCCTNCYKSQLSSHLQQLVQQLRVQQLQKQQLQELVHSLLRLLLPHNVQHTETVGCQQARVSGIWYYNHFCPL